MPAARKSQQTHDCASHVTKPFAAYRHDDSVMAAAFHPVDNKLFLSCAWNGKVRLQSADPPRVLAWKQTQAGLAPLPLHCARFSSTGDKVFVGAMSGRVRQYQLPSAAKLDYHAEVGVWHSLQPLSHSTRMI